MLRYPKTQRERRQWYAVGEDDLVEYKIKRRRSPRDLPTAWDDAFTPCFKSWKHNTKRRKQWRPKELPREKKYSKFRGYSELLQPVKEYNWLIDDWTIVGWRYRRNGKIYPKDYIE